MLIFSTYLATISLLKSQIEENFNSKALEPGCLESAQAEDAAPFPFPLCPNLSCKSPAPGLLHRTPKCAQESRILVLLTLASLTCSLG